MRAVVALGLVLWSLLTIVRLPAWRSDVSLLSAAVATSPQLPRPSVNLGMALLRAGDRDGAAVFLLRGASLAEVRQGPRDAEVLVVARRGFRWLTAFGSPVCASPSYQRYC